MIRYYLGIDAGGTKTAFALADGTGRVIQSVRLGPGNPVDIGMDALRELLYKGISRAARDIPTEEISVFAGVAGGITGDNQRLIGKLLAGYGFGRACNGSDADSTVAAGLRGRDGIAAIIGTGHILFSVKDGVTRRFGGYGYLFDEGGSAYAIARDGILSAFAMRDGTGPDTLLRGMLEGATGQDILSSVNEFYSGGKRYIASFCPLVFEAADKGDAVAREILDKSFAFVAREIDSALSAFEGEIPCALTGGLTARADAILPILNKHLAAPDRVALEICREEPVLGALRLAGAPDPRF